MKIGKVIERIKASKKVSGMIFNTPTQDRKVESVTVFLNAPYTNGGESKFTGETAKELDQFVRGAKANETMTVNNLMTGLPVEIPVNTPRSCDPSCELYWTM